jgi:flagellar hook protein FlgE
LNAGQKANMPDPSTSMVVYDSLGGPHQIGLKFSNLQTPPAGNAPAGATSSWEWSAVEGTTAVGGFSSAGNERLYFDKDGKIMNPTALGNITIPANGPAQSFSVGLNFASMSQLSSDSNPQMSSQDGYPTGALQDFAIAPDGVITGIFTNGLTRHLGQLAMANFTNPGGLERMGNNLYRASDNSGIPDIGAPGSGGRGIVNSGFLEQSNVDISQEFTDLIVTQRGFQANTRVVTTVDEMLQDLINIKR